MISDASSLTPPQCKQISKTLVKHNDEREDPYYWLNDKDNPEVISYLEKENQYAGGVMRSTEPLQEQLFQEITGRIKKDDQSVPYKFNHYWYYTRYEKGKEYAIHCRKLESMDNEEQILLDVNELAKGHSYCSVVGLSVSEDNKWLAFGIDTVSRRMYTIKFLNLETRAYLELEIENTSAMAVWAHDNETVFYTEKDVQTLRTNKIYRLHIPSGKKEMVYEEKDETFYTYVTRTKSRKFILIGSSSSVTSEYRWLPTNQPYDEFQVFQERERGHEYSIAHHQDHWYILTNWKAENFRLMKTEIESTAKNHWEEVIPHRPRVLLEDIELFDTHMVLEERINGQIEVRIIANDNNEDYYLKFEEDGYLAWIGHNPDYQSKTVQVGYTSMITPTSIYAYEFESKKFELIKEQEVVGGYDKTNYRSERLFVEVRDGVKVPVNIVYHKDHPTAEKKPLLLYGYGSYGSSLDPYFSSVRLSLLDRGFSYAIAHIRGGEEMGRHWYEDGKLLNKKNTFNDFVDIGRYLKKAQYCTPDDLYAMGGSAGGLLMGVIINEAPELWKGVIAAVPFVDVVTTMLDDSIPLTTGEYDEWGNPNEEEYYKYIKSYSPYDNVKAQDYPHLLVTTGLHDSQVQYWEPAKWVARMREIKTDQNLLIFKTNMEAGHGGNSGRFARHKETALDYAFLIDLNEAKPQS